MVSGTLSSNLHICVYGSPQGKRSQLNDLNQSHYMLVHTMTLPFLRVFPFYHRLCHICVNETSRHGSRSTSHKIVGHGI